jgi:hypothetical protein
MGDKYIYCEKCGKPIYKRIGKGGDWIDEKAGICTGPCERELCGDCAEWDVEGECTDCSNTPCGQCHFGPYRYEEDACKSCEHLSENKTANKRKSLEEK